MSDEKNSVENKKDYANTLFAVGVKLEVVFFALVLAFYLLWQLGEKLSFLVSWLAWGIFFYYLALQVAKLLLYIVRSIKESKWRFGYTIGIEEIPAWAMSLAYVIVFVIFLGVTMTLIFQVVSSISSAIDFSSKFLKDTSLIEKELETLLYHVGLTQEQAVNIAQNIINNVFSHTDFLSVISEKMVGFVSSLEFLVDIAAGAFASVLIGMEAKNIKALITRFSSSEKRILRNLSRDLKVIHFYMVGFTGNRLLISFIVGFSVWLGFIIVGFPNAGIAALVAIVTDLIPYVGPILGWMFGVVAVMPSVPSLKALIILTAIYIISQVVENVSAPLIYSTNLSVPFWIVILALLVGGKIGGVVGIIIGVPMFTALSKIIGFYFREWEEGHVKYFSD